MSPILLRRYFEYEGGVLVEFILMVVSRDFLADIDSSEKKGQKA